jgi:hypothetical protein
MSPQADMYRQKAAEAKNRAAQASNPHVKSYLLSKSSGWTVKRKSHRLARKALP